ncbi:phage tail sheath C-terminal domain-containing protein [Winogradskyella sp.]|uniref:phage tail sheath C-terminal domain-containing protein n=1 Tax=Winogradskyella sp. TaxID=1883156 RepID=UPI003BAC599B
MISSIKTPGVYIHEINGFPPSIAQVATAIPAFVGYTEKGPTEPVKVTSLLEYEDHFGGAPKPKTISITESGSDLTFDVTESEFKLYNSLRLFFSNGGGECYIVSLGDYKTATPFASADPFNAGLDLLEKVDEVTLLLFPDGVNLGATNLGLVQNHALMQCADLMDRFTVMDVVQKPSNGLEKDSEEFRDAVGNMNLKYGAAYYPYLQSSFTYAYRFMDIQGNGIDFKAKYPALINDISGYETMHSELKALENSWTTNPLKGDKEKPASPIDDEAKVNAYVTQCWNLLGLLNNPTTLSNDAPYKLQEFVANLISNALSPLAQKLFDFENQIESFSDTTYTIVLGGAVADDSFDDNSWKGGATDFTVTAGGNQYAKLISANPDTGDDNVSYPKVESHLNKLHTQVTNTVNAVISAIADYDLKKENDLVSQLPIYPSILSGLNKSMNTVPPSGAIVGIYANTDATRGVWKAPANASVNGIIGLTDDITHKEQGNMNIHESGKSINAIRKFTGKGLLVWGARTLDGNSNDWRYVNVRRLANMIEESTKKACMNFVFEPNVKQTWVNVKGMIENYLTTLWSDGALAGSKPEDAFFVSVGLNETMSPQDINEGRMIVKIGYAPSRPAEFIILEFIQTQQKS